MITAIDFLKEGIQLENLGIIIPWNKKANEIEQYGNPVIEIVNTDIKNLIWNNAIILGGLQLNLQTQFRKSFASEPKFNSIFGYLSERDFDKALLHLVSYFGRQGMLIKKSNNKFFYLWVFNDVEVKLGKEDRFGSNFYLQVDFIKKTGSLFVLKYWMLTLITAPL
ncbi:MAG: hypothetical protein SFU21_06520, partial [Flavihumibacter sp.]|nr:hypothetical protein [Flavihumibacter sp.]